MAGRIRQEDVEAVKERTDITTLVGQYLTLNESIDAPLLPSSRSVLLDIEGEADPEALREWVQGLCREQGERHTGSPQQPRRDANDDGDGDERLN